LASYLLDSFPRFEFFFSPSVSSTYIFLFCGLFIGRLSVAGSGRWGEIIIRKITRRGRRRRRKRTETKTRPRRRTRTRTIARTRTRTSERTSTRT
jgi:hypothetical protein